MTLADSQDLEKLIDVDGNINALFQEGKLILPITTHAKARKKEREINDFMIAIALYYGKKETITYQKHKGTAIKFKLSKNDLCNTVFFEKYSKKLDGLVVIANSNHRSIITTYFYKPILNNERTKSEDFYYRKISNKKHKRIRIDFKTMEELSEY